MKDYYKKMFMYNEWANNRVLEHLVNDNIEDSDTLKIFAHMISAQRLWLDRILSNPIHYEVWPTYTMEECITYSKESSIALIKFAEMLSEDGLAKVIPYKNTKGVSYQNTVTDILSQVINHSTYHRAQIARQIRAIGLEPPVTDYIVFIRE